MDKTVVIMAAGMGSRYGGLKQLDQVGPSGETIIDYSVFDAIRAGFSKVVFIIRRDIEEPFKEQIGARYTGRVRVEYVFQELSDIPAGFSVPEGRTKPWGTAHAMLTAASSVREPFIIINADDFYGKDAFARAAEYLDRVDPKQLNAALVGFLLKNTLSDHGTVSRGVCAADENGVLVDVEENHGIERNEDGIMISDTRDSLGEDTIVSMNMWAFTPPVFEYARRSFIRFLKESGTRSDSEIYIPMVVNELIQAESLQVKVLETSAEWFGVTYRDDKPAVVAAIEGLVAEGSYPKALWDNPA